MTNIKKKSRHSVLTGHGALCTILMTNHGEWEKFCQHSKRCGSKNLWRSHSVFWWHSIVHWEFLSEGQTIKAVYQKRYWTALKKNELSDTDSVPFNNWFFLHNNSPSCNVAFMEEFPANRMVAVLHHPSYLPHLAPVDSFLFPKLKFALNGLHLHSITEIQDAVAMVLNSICKEAFLEGVKKSLWKCKYICKSRLSVCWRTIISFSTCIFFTIVVLKFSRHLLY